MDRLVITCPDCDAQTPTASAIEGELTCPECGLVFPLLTEEPEELPGIVVNDDLLDRVGEGRESAARRAIVRDASREAGRSAVGGPHWWAAAVGGMGGIAMFVAAFLPVAHFPESSHSRVRADGWDADTVFVAARDVHYWDLPIEGPINGTLVTALGVALGMAAIALAVLRLFAGLWMPGIGGLAFASYWYMSGLEVREVTMLASPYVMFAGGTAAIVAALGGTRRGNACVLAALSLIAWPIPLFGAPIGLAAVLFAGLAMYDAQRGFIHAAATGDKRRIVAAARLRTAPMLALIGSAVGLLLSGATFLWFAARFALS